MINPLIDVQKDFYKSELLKMGYFKTEKGLQLYELSLDQLEEVYKNEKMRMKNNDY